MLRLMGLVVVVLLVLSAAHGERRSANPSLGGVADRLVGALTAGADRLNDLVFGTPDRPRDEPRFDGLARELNGWSRSANNTSRRTLAGMVLQACPSLGLVCQPADDGPETAGAPPMRRSNGRGDQN